MMSSMSFCCPSKTFRLLRMENQIAIESKKTMLNSSQHLKFLQYTRQPMAMVDAMIVVPWTIRAKIDKEYPIVFATETDPKT
mmetsp:Transcript_21781/g.54007  ORF Transcript_21781/g.54007 Transcript_21781/m.54007 type:complete len:82 (+) Transcript_21781:59-304(+)